MFKPSGLKAHTHTHFVGLEAINGFWMFWISVALVNSVGEESLEANQEAAVRRAAAAMASREAEITGCSAMGLWIWILFLDMALTSHRP